MFTILETGAGQHTLYAGGELWGEVGQQFNAWMEKLYDTRSSTMILDLSTALSMNSSAIGKLISVLRRANEERRTFRIVGCSDRLFDMFRIIKLDSIIEITRQ